MVSIVHGVPPFFERQIRNGKALETDYGRLKIKDIPDFVKQGGLNIFPKYPTNLPL